MRRTAHWIFVSNKEKKSLAIVFVNISMKGWPWVCKTNEFLITNIFKAVRRNDLDLVNKINSLYTLKSVKKQN